ncbi:hypothetical protein [Okeania sp. SIO1I7]|uniref:hypothetical protein n=1 Tax=Okeania sp. SIO1I7 TaxID=2607772 RepID=UPI0013FA44A1|nr:hypothetical protein [Okeania sp. SIO1I7]NET30160.1 hypothetical protein [Okeania sp. SIO1I7]
MPLVARTFDLRQVESFTKEQGRVLHTRDELLDFSYSNTKDQYIISVPKSKKNGGDFFLDKKLLEAATNPNSSETNEFLSRGDRSVLYFDDSQLENVVARLDKKWGLFATGGDIAAAKKMVGLETINFDELLNTAIKNYQELQEKVSILETEEVVNNQPLTQVLSTEEEISDRSIKSNNEELSVPKQLTLFEYETTSLSADNTKDKNSENLSVREEISKIDIQQQRVEYVASIAEDLLKYVGQNYYEGSEHIAFKDEKTNTLTITTADKTPVMSAGFNMDTHKWENIESNLSEKDVSHFQKVQAIVTQRIEDKHNRIQQQEFVERLAPIIADYHDLIGDKNPEFGGYHTGWDGENKILTLTDNTANTEEKEILAAKLNPDGWENINSKLSHWQADELENHLMSLLDINTEELQAKRFEKVRPIVADILRNFRTNVFEGKYYSAQWDKDSMELSAWSHNERQAFLSAHWDQNSGWQDLSENPISFKIAHHFTEDIQPALEKYRERTTPELER